MPINVDLGQSLEVFVSHLVETGVYDSEGAVIRDAVRMFQAREIRLAALDNAIDEGLADADAGRVETGDSVRAHLRETFKSLASSPRL